MTLGFVIASTLLTLPFSINTLIQGNYLFGILSLFIVVFFIIIAIRIIQGKFSPRITMFGLVPVIIIFLTYSYTQLGILAALWCFPGIALFYFLLEVKHALIANLIFFIVTFPQAWNLLEHPQAARVMATQILVSMFLAVFVSVIEKQRDKLSETQRIAGLGSWEFDVLKQKITWSEEVFRIAGMEGRTEPPSFDEYLEIVHPEDREILQQSLQKALNGESYEIELRHLRPDGSFNYTLTRAKLFSYWIIFLENSHY